MTVGVGGAAGGSQGYPLGVRNLNTQSLYEGHYVYLFVLVMAISLNSKFRKPKLLTKVMSLKSTEKEIKQSEQ